MAHCCVEIKKKKNPCWVFFFFSTKAVKWKIEAFDQEPFGWVLFFMLSWFSEVDKHACDVIIETE